MANLTLVQAINLARIQEMEADPRVPILAEDAKSTGQASRHFPSGIKGWSGNHEH